MTGATLQSITYHSVDDDATGTHIKSALLTFADTDSDGKSVAIEFSDGTTTTGNFECPAIASKQSLCVEATVGGAPAVGIATTTVTVSPVLS